MQALQLEGPTELDNLKAREVEDPEPGAEEVLVEVKAASVSPLDVKNAQGRVPATLWPRIPGRDFAGIVLDGPERLRGQRVWGTGGGGMGVTSDGSHAEMLVRAAVGVRPMPERMSFEQAAAVGVSFTTAWLALVRTAAVQAGETVLIIGAAGSVGNAGIQIARWRGARVMGADQRPAPGLEPNEFFSTQDAGWDRQVKRVDVVFDMVGGALFEPALGCLRHGGRYVAISSPGQSRVSFDLIDFYHRELTLRGVDSLALTPKASAEVLDALAPGFASGALRPPVVRRFPLAQAGEAYRTVAAGTGGDKVVLVQAASA